MDGKLPTDSIFFKQFMRNISTFFEGKAEIVVHDFRDGFDHTIADMAGGITDRKIGDSSSNTFIETIMHSSGDIDDNPVYFGRSEKGVILKTASTLMRDENNRVIGAVCVNLDVTDMVLAGSAIQKYVNYRPDEATVDRDLVAMDVDSLMQHYINMAEAIVGKPMQLMNKDEKIRALAYLDDKGIFKIYKAGVILCEAFQISKFTLYSYLDEAKQLEKKD